MGLKEELLEALGKWASKLDDPSYKERFKDFEKVMQFKFSDIDFTILMIFKNETCTVKEGKVENPDVLIETESEIILGISDGEISPTKAFMGGKLKAKGDMKDMLKIQMLMK
jgi:putative sterol carrier protein